MTLDAAIRGAARKGGFRLNVWKTDTGHQANFSRDGQGWRIGIAADPVAAVLAVLDAPVVSDTPTDNTSDGGIFG